jgi:hypothetical protein
MYLKMIALDFNGHNNGNSLMAVDLRKCNQILEHMWKMLRVFVYSFWFLFFFGYRLVFAFPTIMVPKIRRFY